MNHVLLLIPLLLAVSIPVVYAEVGPNYDTVINDDGTTTWTSHPDRILDNTWQNYFLETDEQKIIFKSNSIGGLIYDVSSCSYSLYENGFDGSQIIPSVSSVATYNPNGVWQHLPLNDLSCVVTVQENENGIVLTSTKEINDNEKYIQELKIDVFNGVKETFKVWHDGTEELGISQTLHTPPEIIIGNTTIPIADYNGMSFDKDFIVANQAEILQLTDSINYDFDKGIESLSNVNILFDETSNIPYKVNLDYASGLSGIPFVNYLEIDPTFTSSSATESRIMNGNTGYSSTTGTNNGQIHWYKSGSWINRSAIEYDISSIPSTAQVTGSTFYHTISANGGGNPYFYEIPNSLTGRSDSQIWSDVYFSSTKIGGAVGGSSHDFTTHVQDAISNGQSEVYWGYKGTSGYLYLSTLSLQVTYTVPAIPTSPQSLSTSQSLANEIILNYQAPSSDGGSAITNYKIYLGGTLIDTIGNVLTYTDIISGSEIGSGLTYSVIAVNAIGDSPASSNSFITSWDVPDAPTGFQAVTGSPITLSWVTPNSDDTITNYKIYRDGTLIDTIGAVNSYSDSTTVSGNSYSYTVSAVSAVGESSQSSASSVISGVSWNPPGSISAIIPDANNSPFGIDVTWSASTQGSGTGVLTGYELWRTNGATTVLVTTGNILTYSDTVTLANTNYHYFVKSTSTHGTSGNSPNSNTVTTPTIPSAITDLSGSVNSDVQITLSYSAPSNGGSNIDLYKIFKDGSQIDTTTNLTYSVTGLTSNTSYTFVVVSNNSVGDSANSNSISKTTYQTVSGSITVTTNTQGATTELTFAPGSIVGTPTPTFNIFTLKEGTTVIASGITSPYYLAHDNFNSNTYTVTSTDNSHWSNPTITGTTTVQSDYSPSWNTANVSYNYTRTSGVMDLMVNKDNSQNTWDASCNYRTTSEVMDDQPGLTSNHTGVWYISESQTLADIDTVYVNCKDGEDTLFSFTSFGPNRLGGGIAQLDDFFGGMTGTPVALIFVLLVAGLFTGRTAPTGILVMLALIGVLGFIGLLTLDEAVWGFLLLAGVLGIFLGKRFL
jgi:hypothetical protein